VKEDKDIYVIPYATERHGNRYHVLEEYKGADYIMIGSNREDCQLFTFYMEAWLF